MVLSNTPGNESYDERTFDLGEPLISPFNSALIAIDGIAFENLIIPDDFTNQLYKKEKPLKLAIREEVKIGFFPIEIIECLISSIFFLRVVTQVMFNLLPQKL